MSADDLFASLRQSVDPAAAAAIEESLRNAPDDRLSRVNVLAFAHKAGVDEERAIAAFCTRPGLASSSWRGTFSARVAAVARYQHNAQKRH